MWLYWTGYGGTLFAVSVPLIASGALGNLVDRFRLGYVVDFIRFHVREAFVWPTFNVADITITVGVALLLCLTYVDRLVAIVEYPLRNIDLFEKPQPTVSFEIGDTRFGLFRM